MNRRARAGEQVHETELHDFVSTTEPTRHDERRRKELLDQGGWRPPPEPDPFSWPGTDVDETLIDIR